MKNAIKRRIKELKKEIQKLEIIRPGKITKQKRGLKEERYHYNYLVADRKLCFRVISTYLVLIFFKND